MTKIAILFLAAFAACMTQPPPTPSADTAAASTPAAQETDNASPMIVTGVVTTEGVECPSIRTDDGRLYTLATRQKLNKGERVRVTGAIAEMSFCMQGTTLSVTKIERLAQP